MSRKTLRCTLTLLALGACFGCGGDPERVQQALEAEREALAPSPAPEGWTRVAASSPMRLAQFELEPAQGEEPAELIVFHFPGGSVQSNLQRWAGQFEIEGGGDPMQAAEIREKVRDELRITTMDLTGVQVATSMGTATGRAERRLLGAIVEATGGAFQGKYFVKVVGAPGTVELHVARFHDFVASFEDFRRSLR